MLQLTARQKEVLELIRKAVMQTGYPPTRAEIAQALGFASPNAAEDHLRALQRCRAKPCCPAPRSCNSPCH
jgi:repressor LexA